MTDPEKQSVTPTEAPKAAENAPAASSSGKSAKQLLEALIKECEELEPLKTEHRTKGAIEDEALMRKQRHIRDDIRTIIRDIQKPIPSADAIQLPRVVLDIIKSIDVDIRDQSAPVMYELLRISTNSTYDFNTPDGIGLALDAMLKVSQFEPWFAEKIIKGLLQKAQAMGCAPGTLERADKFVNPLKYRKSEEDLIKTRSKEWNNHYEAAFAPIKSITSLGDRAIDQIRAQKKLELNSALASGQLIQSDFEKIVHDFAEVERNKMTGEITSALEKVISTLSLPAENVQANTEYKLLLTRLVNEGKLPEANKDILLNAPNNPELQRLIESQYKRGEGDDLVGEALRVMSPNEKQIRILRALSSPQGLQNLLLKEQDDRGNLRYMIGGNINWKEFTKDIKGIFGDLLSIADRNPNLFFQEAFNPMFEGHFYQVLLQRITHLGSDISKSDDPWFKSKQIEIKKQEAVPNPRQDTAPFRMLVHESTSMLDLGVAVGDFLKNQMNDFKFVREHLHNVNAVCTQGLGWEQLKQYSERLNLAHLDNLMREEEHMSLAVNFLSDALKQEVAANGRVVMPQFGLQDRVLQLSSAEKRAYLQMRAYILGQHPEMKDNDPELTKQAVQKIRMASAISYGVTSEFWNIMLTARMPLSTKQEVNAAGENVNTLDLTYTGTSHRGYEKMIGELDLDMVLQRFGLPNYMTALRYCARYRDMKHPPGYLDKAWISDHGLHYEAKKEIENAMINGRSDRLIEMDEQYSYFMDHMRTKCVGLFARGGWRFTNWEASKVFKDASNKQVDHVKTLAAMRQMGSHITKIYLDSLTPADAEKMTREEVNMLLGINKTGSQLTDAEKKLFKNKESLYERLLFNQMSHVIPTKLLQLEDRRYTPQGEKLLREHLLAYLKEQYGTRYSDGFLNLHVYNMFVSALTLAEKSTWMERRGENQDYIFSASDIDNHSNELKDFFVNFKKNMGKIKDSGKEVEIIGDEIEFLRILKGFQSKLVSSIQLPRYHNQNNTGVAESLQKRFANMLSTGGGDSKGNIANLIAADDFDMEHFFFSAGGGYGTPRMMGETFNIASKVNPNMAKLINEVLPDIVTREYKDIHEFEKVIGEKLVPIFKEIHGAISQMEKPQADEFCISLALFISNMIGKDKILRIKGVGSVIDWQRRQRYGTQASLYTDYYPNSAMHPTHALDSNEIYAMGHIILNAVHIAHDDKIIDHFEPVKVLGLTVSQKPVYKGEKLEDAKMFGIIPYKKKVIDENSKNPWYQHVFEKASIGGVGVKSMAAWLENYLPVGFSALMLILIAMAYLANKKNSKKN